MWLASLLAHEISWNVGGKKRFVSSIGPFLVAQRLGSCYIPVAFEARWHTWTSWYHEGPAWSSILCQSRSCGRWHFLAMFVWQVPQWSSNHGSGLKEVRSVVEWKISIDILFMPIQHQEILKICDSERFRVSLRNLEVDRLWFQQLKFPKLQLSASSEGLYGMEEFASSPARVMWSFPRHSDFLGVGESSVPQVGNWCFYVFLPSR